MASFRPFPHPPPSSSFVPTPPPPSNQTSIPSHTSLHPSIVSGAGHSYSHHGGFPTSAYGAPAPPYQFGNPSSGPQHSQQQYVYPSPQPPSLAGPSLQSSSFPPQQLHHPQYYPSSQYSYFNPPNQLPPPPPLPPSSPRIHSSAFPPPPPPSSPPPPPPAELPRKASILVPSTAGAPAAAHTSFRHERLPQSHPRKALTQAPGRVETEEERSARKKREYEKQKLEERKHLMLKQSQAKVLQKTQMLVASSGAGRLHGSMVGSKMGDRRNASFLTGDRVENRLKKPTTFICKMKFRNELPDPTAQPKFLAMNANKDRYAKYTITSLEKFYKPKLHPEPDLGIPLDLLDISVYNRPAVCPPLAPEDEDLLRDADVETPIKPGGLRRKERPTDKGVSWLVNTEYISSLSMDTAKMSMSEKQTKEMRQSRDGRNQFLENLNSREKQIQAIEESFKASNLPPIHQTTRWLKPVKIIPLLPDFDRYDDRFVMVSFDSEPTVDAEMYDKLDRSVRDEHESQAIMKSFVVNGSDPTKQEKFLAYMAPAPDELSKDMYDETEEISYCWVREYHWEVRGDDVDDPTTFLVNLDDDDVARYLPLPTKLLLKKKKAKEGRSSDEVEHYPAPSKITVRKRVSVAVTEVMETGHTSPSHDRVDIRYSKKARSLREDDSDDRPERMENIQHFSGEDDISE